MALDALNQPVIVQASRLDATVLPPGFSQALTLYLIQQGQDFGSVAGKANDAGQGAYAAQVRNEEQDVVLENHEDRISASEEKLQNHEERISAAEEAIVDHEKRISENELKLENHENRLAKSEQDISNLDDRISGAESDISAIELDYVSKSVVTSQSLTSPLNVDTSYSVNGTKVLGARVTGFTAATGTALKSAFNANMAFPVSATYTQAEAQAIATALISTRQRVKALEDALRLHGLIN